jgi:hypothetical protein
VSLATISLASLMEPNKPSASSLKPAAKDAKPRLPVLSDHEATGPAEHRSGCCPARDIARRGDLDYQGDGGRGAVGDAVRVLTPALLSAAQIGLLELDDRPQGLFRSIG